MSACPRLFRRSAPTQRGEEGLPVPGAGVADERSHEP